VRAARTPARIAVVFVLAATAQPSAAAEPAPPEPWEVAIEAESRGPAEEVFGKQRSTSSPPKVVEEIVVQARKRAEALEDTPVSVTALGASTLVDHGVVRLDDIGELVPNLTFQRNPEGQDALVRIRGIGTPRAAIQFDPGVGIYVDGVFLARAAGGLIDVVDVEQIEVLRGPQGTLFGKNTVGGAINISTVRPQQDLGGSVVIRPGNFSSLNARVMLNLPLIEDRLLSRIAFSSDQSDGYVFNETRDEYLSNRDSLNFVGSLRYLALEDLTFDMTGSWARSRSNGRGGRCVFVQETGLQGLVPGWAEECRESEPYRVDANVDQLVDIETYGAWATARWDIGSVGFFDELSLKSITSWREQKPRFRSDSDGTGFQVIELAAAGGAPLKGYAGFARQISEEVQVNGEALDGRLAFVGGYFVYWERAESGQVQIAFPGILNRYSRNDLQTDNWNWAIYSQATLDATDWMSLTAGVRYSEEKKGLSALNRNIDPETGQPLPVPPLTAGDSSAIFSAWTPMATVALTVPDQLLDTTALDHLLGYFTYARGFRGGGFNALGQTQSGELEPFAPEFLDSFEVGAKSIGFDQRVTLNFSLFLAKYNNIQVTSIRDVGDSDGDDIPEILQLTLNAAKATTRGLELEINTIPIDGLQVNGSVGFIDARYEAFTGINDLNNEPINRSGETFNNTPQWQTFLAAQYSLPVDLGDSPWLSGWLTPRLEWAYQSEVHYMGPELVAGIQRGFNLFNARLSYAFFNDRAQVALWGKNLADEGYFGNSTPIANFFGLTLQYYEPPRTFGGELSFRF
jgi:iron complex outermembrane receptor protein